MLADGNELHLRLGSLLLLLLHECPDVLGEELWLDSVDHIEEELLVENRLVSQMRQEEVDLRVIPRVLEDVFGCKLCHSGHVDDLDFVVVQCLSKRMRNEEYLLPWCLHRRTSRTPLCTHSKEASTFDL